MLDVNAGCNVGGIIGNIVNGRLVEGGEGGGGRKKGR